MSNDFPYFKFFPNDWLSSTKRALMTLSEQGAYFNLLCHYWNSSCLGIPDEDSVIRSLGSVDINDEIRMDVLRDCFVSRGGFLHNVRMESEYKYAVEYHKGKVEAGKKGARKRWKKDSTATVLPIAKGMAKDSISQSIVHSPQSTVHSSKPEKTEDGSAGEVPSPPPVLNSNLKSPMKQAKQLASIYRDRCMKHSRSKVIPGGKEFQQVIWDFKDCIEMGSVSYEAMFEFITSNPKECASNTVDELIEKVIRKKGVSV